MTQINYNLGNIYSGKTKIILKNDPKEDVNKLDNQEHVETQKSADVKPEPEASALEAIDRINRGSIQVFVSTVMVEPESEHFQDVYNEMLLNVPAVTTTIEEKELALSYINRMLACSDIPLALKPYWENKKVIIQNEIQNIINLQNIGNDNNFTELEEEFWNYSNSILDRPVQFDNIPDRVEYWLSYYNTCLSYIDRLLNCQDITPEKQAQYQEIRMSMLFYVNNHKADLNRYNAGHGQQTESFYNVFAEMSQNVPDQTTTIPEKRLALSYIERMLSCSDITPELRAYWENKKVIIQNEIQNIINGQGVEVNNNRHSAEM